MRKTSLGMNPLRSLMLLLPLLVAQNCWACYSAPVQQRMSVDEQITLASEVSVARVTSATPLEGELVEYRFVVRQRLAGQDGDTFTVTGRAPASIGASTSVDAVSLSGLPQAGNGSDTSLDGHADPVFWQYGGGRVMNDTDCLIHPDFVVGGTYLVFLNSPWTRRSFEKIALVNGPVNDGDKWLAYVKAGLETRSKQRR